MTRWSALACVTILASACGAPQGPHVRLARASPSQIEAAANSGQAVWYDFEAGDDVPLEFGLLGVSRAVTDQPIRMVAQRPFSIVILPGGQTYFSFDGHSLTPANQAARWSMAIGSDESGGRAALILFIGQRQDLPQELQ